MKRHSFALTLEKSHFFVKRQNGSSIFLPTHQLLLVRLDHAVELDVAVFEFVEQQVQFMALLHDGAVLELRQLGLSACQM